MPPERVDKMATETTKTSAIAWRPDVSTFAASDVIPDAIILQASNVSGSIEGDAPAVRVAYVDDASAQFTAEADTIPEANPTLNETLVYTGKITQLIRLSNEQYRQPGTSGELSNSVRRAVIRKANEAFLAQVAPTAPAVTPPAGVLNIAGIETGGAIADSLDGLVDLIAELEANGSNPSHIILDPIGWASLRKFKTTSGAATSLLGAGTTDAQRMLLDLPVLVSPAMSAGTGLVIDRSAIPSAVGPVTVATSEHLYFNSDSIALRATWRIGWNIVRPDRIGKFTVTAPSSE